MFLRQGRASPSGASSVLSQVVISCASFARSPIWRVCRSSDGLSLHANFVLEPLFFSFAVNGGTEFPAPLAQGSYGSLGPPQRRLGLAWPGRPISLRRLGQGRLHLLGQAEGGDAGAPVELADQ